jgi:transcriptional regulator with XRE-family HTH domain
MEEAALGALVRRLRRQAGLTQEALAERAMLSVRTLSDIESGSQRRPRRDTLESIAEGLGLGDADRGTLLAATQPEAAGRVTFAADSETPSYLPPLVGRDDDIEAVQALLARPDVRILTLTGPGGVGKTRLALEIANRFARSERRETYFVELLSVRDPALVAATVARAVCGRDEDDPEAATSAFLRGRDVLLVADNLEHVRAAAPYFAQIVSALPRTAVLGTSRFALGLRGERLYPVDGLPHDHAVTMLIDRIHADRPGYDPDPDRAALGEIVERLDRLPLAIELVAPRTRVFSVGQLLERLTPRLPLLVSRATDLPERHRTMRNTIGWTYDLLEPIEQDFFRHAAELERHFTVDDAEASWYGDRAAELVESLIEKQLLLRCEHPDGIPRFGMLQTIREFAEELNRHAAETAGR